MADLIGMDIDRYHIIGRLGQGGMAVVYKAFDTHLKCEVAVKIICTDQILPVALQRTMKRFEHEARDVARLDHPNIVKVMDYGEHNGVTFLVMPLLTGGTLSQYISRKGRMDWKEAASLLVPIADALEYAHRHGIIHRDIKPSNILLTSNTVPMLTDFGVAKILDDEVTVDLTSTNATVGTPEYMAPEQIVSKTVDHRADIYALGVIYYEMVTGKRPFTGVTPMETLFKHASEPLPRPTRINPTIPVDVENFLMKALMKKPEDRFSTMGEMKNALQLLAVRQTPVFADLSTTLKVDDSLDSFDQDLDTVDQLGTTDQKISSTRIDKEVFPPPPIKQNQPIHNSPAKNSNMPWVFLGICALIGIFLFIVLTGSGNSSNGQTASSSSSDGYTSPLSQPAPQDSSVNDPVIVAPTYPDPTITPTVFACPGMPPSRVKIGDKVVVCSKERLILRVDPRKTAADIRRFEPGTKFEIIDGPECADDSTWWKALFKYNDKDYIGWVREGTDPVETYFICVDK